MTRLLTDFVPDVDDHKHFITIFSIKWRLLGYMDSSADQKRENRLFLLSSFGADHPLPGLFTESVSKHLQESREASDILLIVLGDIYTTTTKAIAEAHQKAADLPNVEEQRIYLLQRVLDGNRGLGEWLVKLKGTGTILSYATRLIEANVQPATYPSNHKRLREEDDDGLPNVPAQEPSKFKVRKTSTDESFDAPAQLARMSGQIQGQHEALSYFGMHLGSIQQQLEEMRATQQGASQAVVSATEQGNEQGSVEQQSDYLGFPKEITEEWVTSEVGAHRDRLDRLEALFEQQEGAGGHYQGGYAVGKGDEGYANGAQGPDVAAMPWLGNGGAPTWSGTHGGFSLSSYRGGARGRGGRGRGSLTWRAPSYTSRGGAAGSGV